VQSTPAGYESAWASKSTPTIEVKIDGVDASAYVRKATITREQSGDLPDQTSFIGASSAGKATLDLDSPLSPTHPASSAPTAILGRGVTIRAGFGGSGGTVPQFAGVIRNAGFDEAAATQTREVLDGSDTMRAPVTIPAFGSVRELAGARRLFRWPTNSVAPMVAACHACGMRVTPPPPASTVVSIPLIGGFLADIGAGVPYGGIGVGDPGSTWLSAGKWGPVPTVLGGTIRGIPDRSFAWSGFRVLFEAWVYYAPLAGNWSPLKVTLNRYGGGVQLVIGGTSGGYAGRVWVQTVPDAGSGSVTPTAPPTGTPTLTAGWHRVAARVHMTTGALSIWADGTLWTGTASSGGTITPGRSVQIEADVSLGRVQAVNLASDTTDITPSDWAWASPGAVLDQGALEVDSMPTVSGVEAWSLVKEVAAAELGNVGFDESGRFRFRNRTTLAAGTINPVTILGDYDLDNLTGTIDTDGIRTRATSRVTAKAFITAGWGSDYPVNVTPSALLTSAPEIPAGQTVTLTLTSARPMMPLSAMVYQPTTLAAAQAVDAGVVLLNSSSASGSIVTAGIYVGLAVVSPTVATITVANTNAFSVWPILPTAMNGLYGMQAGNPAAWVLGNLLCDDSQAQTTLVDRRNASSAAVWGERVLEFEDSPWRSDTAKIAALADAVLADLSAPRAILAPFTVPGDPRRQVGDPASIPRRGGRVYGRIVAMTTTLGNEVEGHMVQTLTVRTFGPAPVITSVSPSPIVPGSALTIVGVSLDGVTGITIGGTACTGVSSTSTTAAATAPALASGTYDLVLSTIYGQAIVPVLVVSTTSAPVVTLQPSTAVRDVDVAPGTNTVTFTSAASGSPAPTVRWFRANYGFNGSAWVPVTPSFTDLHVTTPTLTQTISYANGDSSYRAYRYQALWTNTQGSTYSDYSGFVYVYDSSD
jgi:hypothetical protein